MGKFYEANHIICIIVSCFLAAFSSSQPLNSITSCLEYHHVSNFSVLPTSSQNSTSFENLLLFSFQNLRFSDYPKPSVIILPETKHQLVSSLLCAKHGGYEVTVRCGGHSTEALSSINAYGKPFVLIDLMRLDRVVVDLESETAWVQGGATLGEVYSTIAEKTQGAFGFAAGLCPTVGTGGHISGGGYGYLTRLYGLAADNVVDALLVDAEGRVLDRAAMGEDVFWAIRGGGGGTFGIVYAWKLKLLKVPPKVTAFRASRTGTVEQISQLVHKWQSVAPFLDDTTYINIILNANSTEKGNISSMFIGLYLGQTLEAKSIVEKEFPELEIREEELNETSWIGSVAYIYGLSTISDLRNRNFTGRGYFKGKSDYVRTPIPIEGITGALNFLVEEPNGLIVLNPDGGEMDRIPSDSIPFPHRAGVLYDIEYSITWQKEDDKNRNQYLSWIRKLYDFMTPFVTSNPREAYVNHLDLDLGGWDDNLVGVGDEDYDAVEKGRIWGVKYFLNNYDRLVKAKTKIDPCNFFRHPQGIPPMFNPADDKHCSNF